MTDFDAMRKHHVPYPDEAFGIDMCELDDMAWPCDFIQADDARRRLSRSIPREARLATIAAIRERVEDWTEYPAFDGEEETFRDGWLNRKDAVLALLDEEAGR